MNNAGNYADHLSVTDALAQSPNTAFVKLEEFTGVPDVVDMAVRLGMKSLATPFIDPNTGRRTDRCRGHQSPETSLLHPRCQPDQRAGVVQRRGDAGLRGEWCPPSPIDAVTDANGQPVPVIEAPCNQAVEPAWRTRC